MANTKIIEKTEVTTHVDADGNETISTLQTTSKIARSEEPDYIKLYTRMWCEFNNIPIAYRPLFMALVTRMSYANSRSPEESQTVYTGKPNSTFIIKECGWSTEPSKDGRLQGQNSLDKGLRELCKCNAIRRIGRGVYQINPNYAGRGEWKYNPRLDRGGVEDLKVLFDFKKHDVKTQIVWADDGSDSEINELYRDGLDVDSSDKTTIHYTEISGGEAVGE